MEITLVYEGTLKEWLRTFYPEYEDSFLWAIRDRDSTSCLVSRRLFLKFGIVGAVGGPALFSSSPASGQVGGLVRANINGLAVQKKRLPVLQRQLTTSDLFNASSEQAVDGIYRNDYKVRGVLTDQGRVKVKLGKTVGQRYSISGSVGSLPGSGVSTGYTEIDSQSDVFEVSD